MHNYTFTCAFNFEGIFEDFRHFLKKSCSNGRDLTAKPTLTKSFGEEKQHLN